MQKTAKIYSGASPQEVAADLAPLVDFQDEGLPLDALDEMLQERLVPHLMRYDRPGFQSMFNAFPEEGAALGARLALRSTASLAVAYNQGVTGWQISPGAATLEELCCQALCRLFGLAPSADATFALAGTYANQQAVYMALHRHAERNGFDLAEKGLLGFEDPGRLALVCSREAHFSLKQAVRVLGLGDRCLVTVDVDANRRLDVEQMASTLDELRRSREVFCVVATAGTTAAGSVDPLQPIAAICRDLGAWFHVDGAYGLAYSLVPGWRPLFAGMELADSLVWDPHKQFQAPIPSSILFVRQWDDLGRVAIYADYFNRRGEPEPNPGLKSLPSTRPFSALPLVASLRHQGLDRVRENLRAPLVAIRALADYIQAQDDLELGCQPDTGILCFRLTPPGFPEEQLNELQKFLYATILNGGERTVSRTALDGKAVLRLAAVSPQVTFEALLETIAAVRDLASEF